MSNTLRIDIHFGGSEGIYSPISDIEARGSANENISDSSVRG